MTSAPHVARLRRLAAALLALVCLAGPAFLALSAAAQADVSSPYDGDVGQAECELLGRTFTEGQGCSREACDAGLVPFRRTFGAEACALRGQPTGYGAVATIDAQRCTELSRRWIPEVNYCASNPDRSVATIEDAEQCQGEATVYVNLTEAEGYFDECLTPERVEELAEQAEQSGSTLAAEASLRSGVQCGYRPGYVFTAGRCVFDPAARPAGGGVLLVGDSLAWRGNDELAALRPTFTIDAQPARSLAELQARLDHYRAGAGEPAGLIVELGASPTASFGRRDLARVIRSVPASTRVMFVLPYYELGSDPLVVSPPSLQASGWMRSIAGSRRHTCVADWPAFVSTHPGILQDGVHTQHAAEGQWARWISQQWGGC